MQLHVLYVKQIMVDIVIYVPVINSFIQESQLTAWFVSSYTQIVIFWLPYLLSMILY